MTFTDFLAWALTAGGCGAVVWGVIAFVNQFWTIPSDIKFYGAMILSFLVPVAAYLGEVALNLAEFGIDGLFAAVAVGYMVSVTIHRTTGK